MRPIFVQGLRQGSTDRKGGPHGLSEPFRSTDRTRTSEIFEKLDQRGPRTKRRSVDPLVRLDLDMVRMNKV